MNKQKKTETNSQLRTLVVATWEGVGELGGKGEGTEKYKWAVTKPSQGCTVRHREYS